MSYIDIDVEEYFRYLESELRKKGYWSQTLKGYLVNAYGEKTDQYDVLVASDSPYRQPSIINIHPRLSLYDLLLYSCYCGIAYEKVKNIAYKIDPLYSVRVEYHTFHEKLIEILYSSFTSQLNNYHNPYLIRDNDTDRDSSNLIASVYDAIQSFLSKHGIVNTYQEPYESKVYNLAELLNISSIFGIQLETTRDKKLAPKMSDIQILPTVLENAIVSNFNCEPEHNLSSLNREQQSAVVQLTCQLIASAANGHVSFDGDTESFDVMLRHMGYVGPLKGLGVLLWNDSVHMNPYRAFEIVACFNSSMKLDFKKMILEVCQVENQFLRMDIAKQIFDRTSIVYDYFELIP